MSLILSGTDGLSDVDGTAATPAIRGTDANTGIFFPAADTIAFSEGGAEAARFDSSGRLGIGTTNPSEKLTIETAGTSTTTSILLGARNSGGDSVRLVTTQNSDGTATLDSDAGGNGTAGFIFKNSGSEKARIDSSGNLLVGTSASIGNGGVFQAKNASNGAVGYFEVLNSASGVQNALDIVSITNASYTPLRFWVNGYAVTQVGSISCTTSATAYNTSSDYRLKENIAPMTGALATVAQLKPCTYTWKADGASGQGFIAHELQDVVPDCVTGEKDAVDAEGKIKPQGIDVSFLVATLTAAIQEQQALITQLTDRITALEGA